jgi:hypothetical protein
MKARLAFAPLFLLATSLLAQESKTESKPADDPIAAQLLKDKEAYVAAVEKAKEDVLKAFDKYYESVKNNKSLKIDAQLAQLEKIEAEKKAFDENGVPPTLPALKVALSEFRTAQKKAEAVGKAAFEKAAKAYRDKGDVKTAGAVLDEMKEFLAKGAAASPTMIRCGNSNLVLGLRGGKTDEGTLVVTTEYVKGDQTQLWRTVSAGDGWVYIENVKSGMVMTANGKHNGVELHIAKKKDGSEYQLWKLTPVPAFKDTVRIVPKPSGLPIGIDGRSKNAGARILLWEDSNENHRYFGFFPPK